ncbi:MAG TPA: hypothetical protein VL371_12545, partial [Gemmataceae bacterium]|nr:hypothetical protein [Gemmataceae bacterium]
GSKLYKAITHAEEPTMPPKKEKLPDKELEVVRKWIAGGALENASGKPAVAQKPKVDLSTVASGAGKPTGPVAYPHALSAETIVRTARPGALVSLAASPWAPLAAIGGQKQILLYNTKSFDLLGVLPFNDGLPYVLRFSRNGSVLLAGGGVGAKSGRVVLYDVNTGNPVTEVGDEFDAVIAADISADQSIVALGGPQKVVKGYSVADGKLLYTIKKHTDWITAIAFSPDGQFLGTADRAGGISVWEAKTGHELFTLAGHKEAVSDLAFRDDSLVMASCSTDGTAKLWNLDEGKEIKSWAAHGNYRPPTGAVGAGTFDPAVGTLSIAFTHDGRIVTCGRDKRVRTWDPNGGGGKQLEPAFDDVALHATFDDDGKHVIAGDYTGKIRVWALPELKAAGELSLDPPSLADRLEAAVKKLTESKPNLERAIADAAAVQEKAKQAEADLQAAKTAAERAKQAVPEAESRAKAAADAAGAAAEMMKKAQADAESKQKEAAKLASAAQQAEQNAKNSTNNAGPDLRPLETAVTEKQKSLDEATKALDDAKAASEKSPDDKDLKQKFDDAQARVGRRTKRLEEAKKTLETARQNKQNAPDPGDEVAKAKAEAEKAAEAAKSAKQAAEDAAKAVEKAKVDAKAAADAIAKAKADADAKAFEKGLPQAPERLKARQAELEKLKTAAAAAKTDSEKSAEELKSRD